MASKNINISMEESMLLEIETWAKSPEENRTLSNAVQTLCRRSLEAMKAEKK